MLTNIRRRGSLVVKYDGCPWWNVILQEYACVVFVRQDSVLHIIREMSYYGRAFLKTDNWKRDNWLNVFF